MDYLIVRGHSSLGSGSGTTSDFGKEQDLHFARSHLSLEGTKDGYIIVRLVYNIEK